MPTVLVTGGAGFIGSNFVRHLLASDPQVQVVNGSVRKVLAGLDSQYRWLVKHAETSHPYIGDGVKTEPTDQFASTNMGDETDTSPYRDESDQDYITTSAFINNMTVLINYVNAVKGQGK
jgi:nucleoside-diphosphate-sugar epimerase